MPSARASATSPAAGSVDHMTGLGDPCVVRLARSQYLTVEFLEMFLSDEIDHLPRPVSQGDAMDIWSVLHDNLQRLECLLR